MALAEVAAADARPDWKLSEDDREAIGAAARAGMPTRMLAARYGVTQRRVQQVIAEAGGPFRRPKVVPAAPAQRVTAERREDVRAALAAGVPAQHIAHRAKLTTAEVQAIGRGEHAPNLDPRRPVSAREVQRLRHARAQGESVAALQRQTNLPRARVEAITEGREYPGVGGPLHARFHHVSDLSGRPVPNSEASGAAALGERPWGGGDRPLAVREPYAGPEEALGAAGFDPGSGRAQHRVHPGSRSSTKDSAGNAASEATDVYPPAPKVLGADGRPVPLHSVLRPRGVEAVTFNHRTDKVAREAITRIGGRRQREIEEAVWGSATPTGDPTGAPAADRLRADAAHKLANALTEPHKGGASKRSDEERRWYRGLPLGGERPGAPASGEISPLPKGPATTTRQWRDSPTTEVYQDAAGGLWARSTRHGVQVAVAKAKASGATVATLVAGLDALAAEHGERRVGGPAALQYGMEGAPRTDARAVKSAEYELARLRKPGKPDRPEKFYTDVPSNAAAAAKTLGTMTTRAPGPRTERRPLGPSGRWARQHTGAEAAAAEQALRQQAEAERRQWEGPGSVLPVNRGKKMHRGQSKLRVASGPMTKESR